MKNKWSLESIREICEENGITTVAGLRKFCIKAYRYACKNGLYEELGLKKDYRGGAFDGKPITYEDVAVFTAEHGIETMSQLHRLNKKYYNWVINHKMYEKLGLEKNSRQPLTGYENKWHDINKVWSYLVRWSEEENTSIRLQAVCMGYGKEYDEWVKQNGDPDKDPSVKENILCGCVNKLAHT